MIFAFIFCKYNSVLINILQLLCLIGEAFDELSDEICGAVVNIRPKGDKLGLWTRDASNSEANLKIGSVINCLSSLFKFVSLFHFILSIRQENAEAQIEYTRRCYFGIPGYFTFILIFLKCILHVRLSFQVHKDSSVKIGSVTKSSYRVWGCRTCMLVNIKMPW